MGHLPPEISLVAEKLLAFLNFSTGAPDPQLFSHLNQLYGLFADRSDPPHATYQQVSQLLQSRLEELSGTTPAFADCRQAREVLQVCFQELLPAYREFHADVLFHQSPEFLFNSFFVGRALEVILQRWEGLQESESSDRVSRLLRAFNDYVGHRPVAVLENRKCEPYPHEWIRPVPIYVQGVGAAVGPYQRLVEGAWEILRQCDPAILRQAHFDLAELTELAVDPRALDFDHPVNRRPNHHFGQWDEHSVDGRGYYRRFIVYQITLDSMLARVQETHNGGDSEMWLEASAVLACTMMMGSGISGRGPGAHDSSLTLSKLVPQIAAYRDLFYADLIQRLPAGHRERLLREAQERHQPFGGVRQDINNRLSQQRDRQLIHCRLALVYARLGYRDAALNEVAIVPVAAARLNAQLDCLLGMARRQITQGELEAAAEILPEIFQQLQRGIQCGAIVDPWNILGFDGNYSLFPAAENSIRDHRVDDLVELINQIFSVYSELWTGAAAADQVELCRRVREQFLSLVTWWRQFAAHEVMSVDTADPQDVFDAAQHVAGALNLWHRGGAATGDLEFWSQHAQMFDSPSAYRLVIEALLDRRDFNTSRALLVHWLSQAERIELQQGDSSLYDLVWRWISEQQELATHSEHSKVMETWTRIQKFYDYLEANAEDYWKVPQFGVGTSPTVAAADPEAGELDEDVGGDDVLRAAYEDVIYADETDDGFDGSVFDFGSTSETELEAEVDRVIDRLEFLSTIAEYWRIAAMFPLVRQAGELATPERTEQWLRRGELYAAWLNQALANRRSLFELLDSVHGYALPVSGVDSESMLSYDRQRLYKESLIQQIIGTCVTIENAIRMLAGSCLAIGQLAAGRGWDDVDERLVNQRPLLAVIAAALLQDGQQLVEAFPRLNDYLQQCRLLYVPLSRGGSPREIVQFRTVQASIRELLGALPMLGLLTETYELTKMAMTMERNMPIDQGAVTEFDELFRVAFAAMIRAVVAGAQQELSHKIAATRAKKLKQALQVEHQERLFQYVEDLTESLLLVWLEHSRTLRLSVLERVIRNVSWQPLVKFIKSYGADLFTQEFLQLSNIRAILHQGVDDWLYKMQRSDLPNPPRLIAEIGRSVTLRQAIDYLTLILESIIENYPRYRDYNATTTQSDHGEMLYVLLDFLRLERRYDRVSWHLKPVVWAHEILVRQAEVEVARDWRRSLTERVGGEANRYISMLKRLRRKYSVQMASIGQHLEGRFVKPMLIDRLVALVPDAVVTSQHPDPTAVFEMLKFECDSMAAMSPGVGMDIPDWLAALEEEVDKLMLPPRLVQDLELNLIPGLSPTLDWEALVEQIQSFPKRGFMSAGDGEDELEEDGP